MQCHLLQDGVVFLQLHSFRVVLLILGSDIPAGTRLTTVLMFRTFQDDLYAVSFLCHITRFICVVLVRAVPSLHCKAPVY